MAKRLLYNRGSIEKGTNKLICESRCNSGFVKPGSYVKFESSAESYQVANSEEKMFIFDFLLNRKDVILIENEEAKAFVIGDVLDITYKEFELYQDVIITKQGQGYSVGDIIELNEGEPFEEKETGIKHLAKLRVIETDSNGGIRRLRIDNSGKYVSIGQENILLNWKATGGRGTGLELNLTFNEVSNRAFTKREVSGLKKAKNGWFVFLNYDLPFRMPEGKVSCVKRLITLTSEFSAQTKFSEHFNLIVDFTENYNLPILLENSFALPFVYNKGVHLLDAKIKELEERIKKLEG
tara:strand:- start:1697 stop:2581 length:885 start_codon:yes stop_codon:yes gene_type:complete